MRINSNIPALNTHRLLTRNTNQLQTALERLSSGKRINKAADDAAGLAISQKMEAQIQGLRQASRNGLDGISMIQTVEGALNEVHAMLQRMRELSVQGANEIYEKDDLEAIIDEIKELTEQIDKISKETDFNGVKIFTGEKTMPEGSGIVDIKNELNLQVGANKGEHIVIYLEDFKVDTEELGREFDEDGNIKDGISIKDLALGDGSGNAELDLALKEGKAGQKFSEAIEIYDKAIGRISSVRSKMGAIQNRLESTIANVDNSAENLTAAKSRIEDLDMALEMSNFTKLQVLQQASTAMLGEANALPQSVLQLLQG